MYFYSNYLELGMKNDEDEEEKSHLIEVNPVIEFEKLDKGNYFQAKVGCVFPTFVVSIPFRLNDYRENTSHFIVRTESNTISLRIK